jgi:hypothetical protein
MQTERMVVAGFRRSVVRHGALTEQLHKCRCSLNRTPMPIVVPETASVTARFVRHAPGHRAALTEASVRQRPPIFRGRHRRRFGASRAKARSTACRMN